MGAMIYQTEFKELKLFKAGKVRDVYDLGDKLLIVATDRISCFDVVLPTPIPDKGKILTQISLFWFSYLKEMINNHIVSSDIKDLPFSLKEYENILKNRFMIVKKCGVIPFECVVRGYISGSAWGEYKKKGSVCGVELPSNLREGELLEQPLFTPATKAASGHDENVGFSFMEEKIGNDLARRLKEVSLAIYKKASVYAKAKGIIIADTKFEFGLDKGELILVDEVLTPDSSRFWDKDAYLLGKPPKNFDKQFVRDYLETINWDKTPPGPILPQSIVIKTLEKYKEASKVLTEIIP
ncbi:MAG: phosphoribosylaminoimidazolesuccinocarboxamide synthase [Candidatus Omnitrophica bacterium]|nr:phosphoribosylaminoimidazolesuccinocarboxamide synthase [Candidatus Omnitrophota bacterium]